MTRTADIVICGAGIAGISTAYQLAVIHHQPNIILVDERSPLSLTSDKSTECYRNWWPGPGTAMVQLMNRSIDILEELAKQSSNIFHLNRRGYLYLTARKDRLEAFVDAARQPASLGAGELRVYPGGSSDSGYITSKADGFPGQPDGADLFLDPGHIRKYFPYISQHVIAALHVRRAGWFSAQQLGSYMLEQARAHGVRLINSTVESVLTHSNQISGVILSNGEHVSAPIFVNAAGPMLAPLARMINIDLPVFSELHLKVAIHDYLSAVPRNAPMLIWTDSQVLPWNTEERKLLSDDASMSWLLEELPGGAHTRPEGAGKSDILLLLWEYHTRQMMPVFPPPMDELYPEVALRGLVSMIPSLQVYLDKMPRPSLDGGYYTKTLENRPLIGPLPVEGAFVIGALSGFGLMAACGAGELVAMHITGSKLPGYAPAFSLARYHDPGYMAQFSSISGSGQL